MFVEIVSLLALLYLLVMFGMMIYLGRGNNTRGHSIRAPKVEE